jgi:hypothetical protein
MKMDQSKQGSPEWHQARAGVITASMFSTVRKLVGGLNEQQQKYVDAILEGKPEPQARTLAGYKSAPRAEVISRAIDGEKVGEYSEATKEYAFRLAVERIGGIPLDESFETWQMRRGRELEEDCRLRHEQDIEFLVEEAGFIYTEDRKFGCSADSLVGQDGGGEYKCFLAPAKIRDIVIYRDWGEIMDQVQGCLWLTNRKWWDMCLYCPPLAAAGKDFIRKRVERDDDYIEALQADLIEFEKLVSEWQEKIENE